FAFSIVFFKFFLIPASISRLFLTLYNKSSMSQRNEQPSGEKDPLEPDVRQIVQAAGNEALATEEKAVLWERIEYSISEERPVYRRLWWKVAAAVVVLAAAGWWMLREKPAAENGVLAFARQQQPVADTSTETRLVLGNNRQVTL